MIKEFVDLCARPFAPEWWSVEEHQQQGFWEFNLAKISLYVSEKISSWDDLRKELLGKPAFNANLLDHLLVYKELIPETWKKIKVFFWGTVYRFFGSDLRVRFLCWDGADWQWDFAWLKDVFDGNCQMALLKL
ncbi:MAG: hypothetical protein NT165_01015 [Candidatus Falkowbacteria bacterium]|nr:hypothetical protein [Candidatus Falkowbacteria bacterium]